MSDVDLCFRLGDDEPWHDYDDKRDASVCGLPTFKEATAGTRWAVKEVGPQPMCKQCKEQA